MGKAALGRIRQEGVSRVLVGVELGGERISFNDSKWPVIADGSTIGRVTSALYSPRLEKNIGYAWVPVSHSEPGTRLTVSASMGSVDAVVVRMPFVDPAKEIPKS
jgi:glycine cleavage system aminomethyltransferase T